MGVGVMFLSFEVDSQGKLKRSSHFFLDTEGRLFDFSEAIENRRDTPEDVAFDWMKPGEVEEGQTPEESLMADDCFLPNEILPALRWIKQLAAAGDSDIADVWETLRPRLQQGGTFSPSRFDDLMRRDLDGLIGFCETAEKRGERVVAIWVP